MNQWATVYALIDPFSDEIRYIGWTSAKLSKRLYEHLYCSKHKKTHKDFWLQKLIQAGIKPEIRVIQKVPVLNGNEAECYWIKYFRTLGCNLTNLTDGGGGILGYEKTVESKKKASQSIKAAWERRRNTPGYKPPRPTEKSLEALRKAQILSRGKPRPESAKVKMKAAWKRRRLNPIKRKPHSAETKEKLRQATLRQFIDPAAREAVSRIHKGKTISAKQRAIISSCNKKRWKEWRDSGATVSEETREKIRASKIGKSLSDETRAKLSAATKGRPKTKEHRAKIAAALQARKVLKAT